MELLLQGIKWSKVCLSYGLEHGELPGSIIIIMTIIICLVIIFLSHYGFLQDCSQIILSYSLLGASYVLVIKKKHKEKEWILFN